MAAHVHGERQEATGADPGRVAEEVGRRVETGRSFRKTVSEILTANAELLVLERKQCAKRRKKKT